MVLSIIIATGVLAIEHGHREYRFELHIHASWETKSQILDKDVLQTVVIIHAVKSVHVARKATRVGDFYELLVLRTRETKENASV